MTHASTGLTVVQRRWLLACMALILTGISLGSAGLDPLIPGLPFKDSDDVLRMLQVLAWRDGGDWYDLTQCRIDPPEGLAMHWSRLPDLPLIAILLLTEPWLGRDGAILITATLVPVLTTLIYFMVFVWAARPLTGRESSHLAGLIALCTSVPLLLFNAGRIDHHGWQLILALVVAGGLLRLAPGDRQAWLAPLVGLAVVLGLWIGAEAVPLMVMAGLALTLLWWQQGLGAAQHLAAFGLSTLFCAGLLMPLALAPGHRDDCACDAFSLYSLALAGATALFGTGALAFTLTPWAHGIRGRVLASLLLALPVLALLAFTFPHCLANPYGAIEPTVAELIALTSESIPLGSLLVQDRVSAAYLLALPLAGLILVTWLLLRGSASHRSLWWVLFVLVGVSFILPWWQSRGGYLANVYAGLAFTWLAANLASSADQSRNLLARLAKRLGPAALVAFLPPVSAHLIKPAAGQEPVTLPASCDISPALTLLNQPEYQLQAPRLIAAPIFDAATILWTTPHTVLAGPYHRNARGLGDYLAILRGQEAAVRAIIARRKITFLLVCPAEVERVRQTGARKESFLRDLVSGARPSWLERLSVDGDLMLFRVTTTDSQDTGT